jgi:hypothetical protein
MASIPISMAFFVATPVILREEFQWGSDEPADGEAV